MEHKRTFEKQKNVVEFHRQILGIRRGGYKKNGNMQQQQQIVLEIKIKNTIAEIKI